MIRMVLEGARPSFVMNCWRRRFPTSLCDEWSDDGAVLDDARRRRPTAWPRRGGAAAGGFLGVSVVAVLFCGKSLFSAGFPDFFKLQFAYHLRRDHNPPVETRRSHAQFLERVETCGHVGPLRVRCGKSCQMDLVSISMESGISARRADPHAVRPDVCGRRRLQRRPSVIWGVSHIRAPWRFRSSDIKSPAPTTADGACRPQCAASAPELSSSSSSAIRIPWDRPTKRWNNEPNLSAPSPSSSASCAVRILAVSSTHSARRLIRPSRTPTRRLGVAERASN